MLCVVVSKGARTEGLGGRFYLPQFIGVCNQSVTLFNGLKEVQANRQKGSITNVHTLDGSLKEPTSRSLKCDAYRQKWAKW